ncbi:MAG: HvfX family Cu-binding RiPP maturation protein [Gammaproteobacteria bacterium]
MIQEIQQIQKQYDQIVAMSAKAAFLAPTLFRLLLAWVFFWAGYQKLSNLDGVIAFFGQGLGFPFPTLMVALVITTELIGGLCMLLGLAVRLWTIPMMFTMVVAVLTVHAEHGWYAIAQSRFDNPPGWAAFLFNDQNVSERVSRINQIVSEHGNIDWIKESGRYSIVLLQNGIEFGAMYFMMLLSLFFTGPGCLSLDCYLRKYLRQLS